MASYSVVIQPSVHKDLRRLPKAVIARVMMRVEAMAADHSRQELSSCLKQCACTAYESATIASCTKWTRTPAESQFTTSGIGGMCIARFDGLDTVAQAKAAASLRQAQGTARAIVDKPVDRCDLCGGELRPGTTVLEIWCGEELIVIRDVPADVCQQCREAYISAHVSEQLDHFLDEHHQHRPERYLAVPQYGAVQVMGE